MKRVLIVGATSAIARALARILAQRGDYLVLAGRNQARLETLSADLLARGAAGVEILDYDAMDTDPGEDFVARAWGEGLDLLCIAHGSLPVQEEVQDDPGDTLRALQVNGLSAVGLLAAFAARFEARGQGSIVVLSSVAGDRGRQSNYVYGAAKSLVSTYLSGLENRLQARGVTVLTVKPGFVDTPMTRDFPKGPLWASPERVAADIARHLERGGVLYTPWFWRYIMWVIRLVPGPLFRRLKL